MDLLHAVLEGHWHFGLIIFRVSSIEAVDQTLQRRILLLNGLALEYDFFSVDEGSHVQLVPKYGRAEG